MSITYLDVQHNNLIDNRVLGVLPSKCDCGNTIEFSESLKEISCTSDTCASGLEYRIDRFCTVFKVPLSKESAKSLIEKASLLSPYQLMLIPDGLNVGQLLSLGVTEADEVVERLKELKERPTKLGEILLGSGIDTFDFISDKLTDGIYTFGELFSELDKSQLSFVTERLGAFGSAAALGTVIIDSLNSIKEELLLADQLFNLWEEPKKVMRIAFCDNAKPFLNRAELLEYLNNSYKEYKFVLDVSITEKTDVLILNANSSNSKLRDAHIINDMYSKELVNEHNVNLRQLGEFNDSDIKPLGSKVFVASTEQFMSRLNKVLGYE